MTLISHFPLPSMPFQTHENIVFEKADKDRSSRNNEEFKPEQPNRITPDTPVEDLKLVNQMYAYICTICNKYAIKYATHICLYMHVCKNIHYTQYACLYSTHAICHHVSKCLQYVLLELQGVLWNSTSCAQCDVIVFNASEQCWPCMWMVRQSVVCWSR